MIITFIIMGAVLFLLPFTIVKVAEPHEFMGIMIILFFIVNPIAAAVVNSMIGKVVRKFWWMPALFAIVFLLSYWLVLEEIIIDLMFYAVIYFIIGLIFMLGSFFVARKFKR